MPKTKKDSTSDSDSGPEDRTPAKKSKPEKKPAKTETTASKSGNGETKYWTLEKLRQVRINEFRGRKMVDIREFYEKDGDILPGKKGICLTPIQWHMLLEHKDEITEALKDQ